MKRKIKVTISKEDKYIVQDLIDEIKQDPRGAFELCEVYGCEGFTYDAFTDLDSLTQEARDRLIEDLATSKSEADAELSEDQVEKFEFFSEFFEEEN